MVGKQKILIVDDDENIAELISLYLTKECFDTKIVYNGEDALTAFDTHQPNLVMLDLMLPGLSGEEVLSRLREDCGQGIPVIVLSAKTEVSEKVALLLGGAADYVTKPFDTRELLARITVQLRRPAPLDASPVLAYEGISIHTDSRSVTVEGCEVRLTRTEYAILKLLMSNPSQVITKSLLLDRIGADTPDCTESSLKMHVSNLRKKLKTINDKDYIEAVWGIGFKMKGK